MKLKGIKQRVLKNGEVVVTPLYWGNRGSTIEATIHKVKAKDAKTAVKQLTASLGL